MVTGFQIRAEHPMARLRTTLTASVGYIKPALGARRLAHESVSQPSFPDDLAGFGLGDDDGATLGIECDISVFHYRSCRAIVFSLHLPHNATGFSVKRIKLM